MILRTAMGMLETMKTAVRKKSRVMMFLSFLEKVLIPMMKLWATLVEVLL